MNFPGLLRVPDSISIVSQGQTLPLQRSSETTWSFPKGEAHIRPAKKQQGWEIQVYAPKFPLQALCLRWQQRVEAETRFLGDHWERAYGDLEWRGIVPERVMPWYFLASDGESTYACGVKTGAAALCFWRSDRQGITLTLDLRCGGRNVCLGERVLQAGVLLERHSRPGETPFEASRSFARQLCDQPLLPKEPVYGANDYYHAYCANTHTGIVRDSHNVSELSPNSKNRPYSVVDAGWQWAGDVNGSPWHVGNARFPNMPGLAEEIRLTGCRPGIWFRPLLTTEALPLGWMLPNDRFPIHHEPGHIMDPSLPEVLERIAQDVRTFTGWGYELIKHDYTTFDLFGRWGYQMGAEITDTGWSFADRSRTTAEIIRNLYAKIHEAAGESIVIACNTIGHLAAGAAHLQRVGDDTSGKEWARTRKMGINSLAFRISQHEALFAIDADCVGVTNLVPWNWNRQWLDLLSRSSTPLFVSIDPEAIGREKRKELQRALERAALPAPVGEPLNWMATTVPDSWCFGNETFEYQWF